MSFWRNSFLLAALSAQATACAPIQQYYMKEKQTGAAPRPAIQVDRFAYGKAIGSVDVLFVVDNTESGEAAKEAFRQSYADFTARFKQPEARLLDYRLQVVTNPGNKSPGNWTSQSLSAASQLAELFDGGPDGAPPVLSHSESGFLTPLQAAVAGLSHKAFEGRASVPLFLVFLLGDDVDPSSSPETVAATFSEALKKTRGFYQTSAVFLSRTSNPSGSSFPHCDTFYPAAKVLPTLRALPWRSQTQKDLCDSAWSSSLASSIFTSLIDFKKKLVLSRPPYQPETMLLRTANHLFRYGDDYRLDLQSNEIIFNHDPGLQEGDLIDASYYLTPNEELLSNGQTPFPPRPGPSPSPGS